MPTITVRPLLAPAYQNAPVTLETFERWFICNERALRTYWAELSKWTTEPTTLDEFLAWCEIQYEVACIQAQTRSIEKQSERQHEAWEDRYARDVGVRREGEL